MRGLQVGNLNEGVMEPADEQSLVNKSSYELIQTIKTQNAHLKNVIKLLIISNNC